MSVQKQNENSLVDNYIASFSDKSKSRLLQIRSTIKETAPESVESISYGLVGYKYKNKPLVYFGGFTNHIGLYATPNGHEAFREEFAPYKQGKGSVQFPLDEPLPLELIKRVVEFRLSTLQYEDVGGE